MVRSDLKIHPKNAELLSMANKMTYVNVMKYSPNDNRKHKPSVPIPAPSTSLQKLCLQHVSDISTIPHTGKSEDTTSLLEAE